jgi:magnesium transporter
MYQLIAHHSDGHCKRFHDPAEISDYVADPKNTVWVDILATKPEEVRLLKEELDLHPLAIEDSLNAHQKPKIESYDKYYFVVIYALEYKEKAPSGKAGKAVKKDKSDDEPELISRQVSLFFGTNYMVTIHNQPISEIQDTVHRWEVNREAVGTDVGSAVYALFDTIVDSYFPILDKIDDRLENLEERIFESARRERSAAMEEIFYLRKILLQIRHVVSPARDVVNALLRRDAPLFSRGTIVYLQDIYDHITRVIDQIDTYREMLNNTRDTYLSVLSNRMNETMRVLTAASIMLMSSALIAGIYGMNFKVMPELEWLHGYPFSLALMAIITGSLFLFFRKRHWL